MHTCALALVLARPIFAVEPHTGAGRQLPKEVSSSSGRPVFDGTGFPSRRAFFLTEKEQKQIEEESNKAGIPASISIVAFRLGNKPTAPELFAAVKKLQDASSEAEQDIAATELAQLLPADAMDRFKKSGTGKDEFLDLVKALTLEAETADKEKVLGRRSELLRTALAAREAAGPLAQDSIEPPGDIPPFDETAKVVEPSASANDSQAVNNELARRIEEQEREDERRREEDKLQRDLNNALSAIQAAQQQQNANQNEGNEANAQSPSSSGGSGGGSPSFPGGGGGGAGGGAKYNRADSARLPMPILPTVPGFSGVKPVPVEEVQLDPALVAFMRGDSITKAIQAGIERVRKGFDDLMKLSQTNSDLGFKRYQLEAEKNISGARLRTRRDALAQTEANARVSAGAPLVGGGTAARQPNLFGRTSTPSSSNPVGAVTVGSRTQSSSKRRNRRSK